MGALVASRRLPYIYVQNSKCASSTIRQTLWTAEHARGLAGPLGHPHDASSYSPWVHDQRRWELADGAFVFTVVRNPYSRVLSAYMDKVVAHRDPRVWGVFARRHGLGEGPLAFMDFLRLVWATPDHEKDQHWRPQVCGLMPQLVPYDFVGRFESLEDDLGTILRRIFQEDVPIQSRRRHGTNSVQRHAEHFGPAEIALAQRIYEQDFALLGYSLDPGVLAASSQPVLADPHIVRSWGRAHRLMQERRAAEAVREFEALSAWVAGPPVEEYLLRCRCGMTGRRPPSGLAANVARVEQMLASGYGGRSTWKTLAVALRRLGRAEDGLQAEIVGLQLPPDSRRSQRRVARLRWRLMLLQASKGRYPNDIGVMSNGPPMGIWPRALIRLVASLATVVRAAYWHPDRSVGIPAMTKRITYLDDREPIAKRNMSPAS